MTENKKSDIQMIGEGGRRNKKEEFQKSWTKINE